jgi:hypothetical protein
VPKGIILHQSQSIEIKSDRLKGGGFNLALGLIKVSFVEL